MLSNVIRFIVNSFSRGIHIQDVVTVLCKSNDSEFRRISCFVLNEISPKFRRTFALETCEIFSRLSEISKGLTKVRRNFAQEKCEISESVTKFRRIFALEVCEISKGETKIS